jgi:antirestriction protein ArdC
LQNEIIHSTGHPKGLNRFEDQEVSTFNSTNYFKEELVAEIGAPFLNGFTGILNEDTLHDSAAYIKCCLNILQNDKKFIVEASTKAQ